MFDKIYTKISFSQYNYKEIEKKFLQSIDLDYVKNYLLYIKEQFNNLKNEDIYLYKDIFNDIVDGFLRIEWDYNELKQLDNSINSYIKIHSIEDNSGLMDVDILDGLRTKLQKVKKNTFRIIDISRSKYNNEFNINKQEEPMEYLGILPVITTAPNALYYQKLIENSNYNFK
jgi:hypothetical protein